MKAIFMTEVGGRLMELERREIPPSPVYRRAVRAPIELQVIASDTTPQAPIAEQEVWVAVSKPVTEEGFAVFLLDRIE